MRRPVGVIYTANAQAFNWSPAGVPSRRRLFTHSVPIGVHCYYWPQMLPAAAAAAAAGAWPARAARTRRFHDAIINARRLLILNDHRSHHRARSTTTTFVNL